MCIGDYFDYLQCSMFFVNLTLACMHYVHYICSNYKETVSNNLFPYYLSNVYPVCCRGLASRRIPVASGGHQAGEGRQQPDADEKIL